TWTRKSGWRRWLRWQDFPLIISQGHSTNRWGCRLTATFWAGGWNERSICFMKPSFRCRKSRSQPDFPTRAIWHVTSGGGRECPPGWRAGTTDKALACEAAVVQAFLPVLVFTAALSCYERSIERTGLQAAKSEQKCPDSVIFVQDPLFSYC